MTLVKCIHHDWSGTENISSKATEAIKNNTLDQILYTSIIFEELEFPLVVTEGEIIHDVAFSTPQVKIENEGILNLVLSTLKPMCYKCVEVYAKSRQNT